MPDLEQHNTFLNVAAQFSILPYIQAKMGFGMDVPGFKTPKDGFSLLDHAVLGYEFFIRGTDELDRITPRERRLSTVKYLLEADSKPGKGRRGYVQYKYRKVFQRPVSSSDHDEDHGYNEYHVEVNLLIKAAKRARVMANLGRVFTIFGIS